MPSPAAFEALERTLRTAVAGLRSHATAGAEPAACEERWRVTLRLAAVSVVRGSADSAVLASAAATAGVEWLASLQTHGRLDSIRLAEYRRVLSVVGAVGTAAEVRALAWAPFERDATRDPEPNLAGAIHVWRAWWRDATLAAVRDAQSVADAATLRARSMPVDCQFYEDGAAMVALRAVADNAPEPFTKALTLVLKWHRVPYELTAADPLGAVSFMGLLLARQAREHRGWTVVPGPYLPAALLSRSSPGR